MWQGLTVKQLGLFPSRKQIKSSNLKKKSLLVHKEIKIKIHEMFNECFHLWMLRHLSRVICSPTPNPNRYIGP